MKKTVLKTLLTICLLLSAMTAQAQVELPEGFQLHPDYNFIILADKGTVAPLRLPDSIFNKLATSIKFEANKFDVDPNNPMIENFHERFVPYLQENKMQLAKIYIRGAASPDGSYDHNLRLARRRGYSIVRALTKGKKMAYPIGEETTAEDYMYLLELMHEANDSCYQQVKDIYDKYQNAQLIKSMLKKDKKLWNYLMEKYFPSLRTTRIVILCRHEEDMKVLMEVDPLDRVPKPKFMRIESDSVPNPTGSVHEVKTNFTPVPISGYNLGFYPRREFLSVKTNLPFYGAYLPAYGQCPIPNVAIEYYPLRGHFTYGASLDCPWWGDYNQHRYFQIRNYQVFTRFYLRKGSFWLRDAGEGAAFKGLFVSAYAHAGLYNFCFNENKGWEGEGWGAGVGAGYVIGLGSRQHWRLEITAQVGYFRTNYDPYQWLCPILPDYDPAFYYYKWYGESAAFTKRQHRYTWFGPTRFEINLSYDILYRRIKKPGIGFKSKERK